MANTSDFYSIKHSIGNLRNRIIITGMVIKDYSTVQLHALHLWQRSGHFNSNGQVHEWRMILATQIVDKVQGAEN